jgi:glycerol-3-phosphate acyltransferase PlsY
MRELMALTIGYLLGSFLPAVVFARARGVDIRTVGTRNPGATNALQQLGTVPGLVTGAYDAAVGIVSMLVASAMGLPLGWTYLAGIAAIVGHCFPVFFGFRGGQGMAATTGLLVYEMGVGLVRGWLTVTDIALLVVPALLVFALTRSATMVGVIVAPMLLVEVVLGPAEWQVTTFVSVLVGFIWTVQLGIAHDKHLFRLAEPVRSRFVRSRRPQH